MDFSTSKRYSFNLISFNTLSKGSIDFESEESRKKIKENFGKENFSFETVSKKDALDLIKELPGNKATVLNDIPVSVLKKSVFAVPFMKN